MASRFKVHNRSDGSIEIRNGHDVCLVYKIEGFEQIYISKISKCSVGKPLTREAIKMVEDFAKSDPDIRFIYLDDESSINVCGVPLQLRYLKILTTGQSWYNSFGYKSLEHDADVAHNAQIINKPMNQLLSELSYTEVHMFPRLSPTLENLQTVFPGLSVEKKVKDYVTAMSNQLPRSGTTSCLEEDVKKARLLYNLIDAIRGMLRYNESLRKMIKPHAGRDGSFSGKRFKYSMGGAKITIRKSRRKRRTRKYIKRKTA
jgi:hypothetical protein